MEYQLEKYENDYFSNEICAVWKDALTGLDVKRISWTYENNPHGRSIVCTIKDKEKDNCFGSCALIPRKLIHNEQGIKGAVHADFAIKKEYRSLGPAIKLLKSSMDLPDDVKIIIGFPNNKSDAVMIRAGFKKIGKIKRFVKVFRSKNILKKKYSNFISLFASPIVDVFLKIKMIKLYFSEKNVEIKVNDKFDSSIDTICEQGQTFDGLYGKRDVEFLKWRFTSNPYQDFKVFTVKGLEQNHLKGYIVYFIEKNIVNIEDYKCIDPISGFEELYKIFSKFCMKNGYDALSIRLISSEKVYESFLKLGFRQMETSNVMIYKAFNDNIYNTENVFFTRGDMDF